MPPQVSCKVDQKETIIHFRTFRLLWFGCFCPLTSGFLGAGMFPISAGVCSSLDKQLWTYWTQSQNTPAVPPSSCSVCDWEVFVSSALPPGVCLTLVQLGLVSPRSHQSACRPVEAIWVSASSAPVSAVRDWLTDGQYPFFALWPAGQRQHVSPNRHPHLHAHKSLKTTGRADNEARHSYFAECSALTVLSTHARMHTAQKSPFAVWKCQNLWCFCFQRLKHAWLKALTRHWLIAALFGNEFASKLACLC